jgi:hypothetical protein
MDNRKGTKQSDWDITFFDAIKTLFAWISWNVLGYFSPKSRQSKSMRWSLLNLSKIVKIDLNLLNDLKNILPKFKSLPRKGKDQVQQCIEKIIWGYPAPSWKKMEVLSTLLDKLERHLHFYQKADKRVSPLIESYWSYQHHANDQRILSLIHFVWHAHTKQAEIIYFACLLGETAIVESILKNSDIDWDSSVNSYSWNSRLYDSANLTFFHIACKDGRTDIARLLIAFKQKPELERMIQRKDAYGLTPLHYACRSGQLALVKLIIFHLPYTKEAFNPASGSNNTPFLDAVSYKQEEIVAYLLTLPLIDVNAKTSNNCFYTALNIAAESQNEKHKRILESILRSGRAWVAQSDFRGLNCLHIVYLIHNQETILKVAVAYLIEYLLKPSNRDMLNRPTNAKEKIEQYLYSGMQSCENNPYALDLLLRLWLEGFQQSLSSETLACPISEARTIAVPVAQHLLLSAAYELFMLLILLADQFLILQKPENKETARFFSIAAKLPIELQMVLCLRVMRVARVELMPSKEIEAATRRIVYCYENMRNEDTLESPEKLEEIWPALLSEVRIRGRFP